MNKSVVVITLFAGFLVAAQKAEATVNQINIFKKMETLQGNPWDPLAETQSDTNSSGREVLPEPEQSESETEE